MKTLSRTFAIITGLVAGLVWPAAASERHPGDDQNSDNGSRFGATACRLPQDGHVQFSNGRDAFRGAGGGGSYGDIFFAGGAGARATTSHGNSSSSTAQTPHGSGGAKPGSGSGTVAPGAGGGGGTPTVTQPGAGLTPPATMPTFVPNPGDNPPGLTSPRTGHHWGKDHPKGISPKVTATPEPGSALLLGTGILGLVARFRRWRKKA